MQFYGQVEVRSGSVLDTEGREVVTNNQTGCVIGDGYFREVGFYQVVLSYPKGTGVGNITTMAELVQDYFKRGTTLVEGSDKIIVDRTPQISPVYINDNRAEITIRIRYYSEQFV